MNWKKIQKRLKELGYYQGEIDGIVGPLTESAIVRFKLSKGLRARPYVGPITYAALMEKKPVVPRRKDEPVWIRRARQEIGVREIKGPKHNARVLWYWIKAHLPWFKTDEIPWCAGFVGAMLESCGLKSTRSGMARSYLNWGKKIPKPVLGAIVVFWRGSRNGKSGHVGFVAGIDQRGNILVLGGNQSDEVNISPFDTDRVLEYRWPVGVPIQQKLVLIENNDETSKNEA